MGVHTHPQCPICIISLELWTQERDLPSVPTMHVVVVLQNAPPTFVVSVATSFCILIVSSPMNSEWLSLVVLLNASQVTLLKCQDKYCEGIHHSGGW